MYNNIIVGGGAAGMLCGIYLARGGQSVTILEKNKKLGKKLYITGKGRCNITNNTDVEGLLRKIYHNPKFMYSAFYSYTPDSIMGFLESLGLELKVERGNRVFPKSDKSGDVINALDRELKRQKVKIQLNTEVKSLIVEDNKVKGVLLANGEKIYGDNVIVATGGLSYSTTGSTGDGYKFAREQGIRVTQLVPSLVPLKCAESYCKKLQGLSLKNVTLRIFNKNKEIYKDFGEMMFTHFGITGPLVLSASGIVNKFRKNLPLKATIDLKPALSEETLDARILREFDNNKNKLFKNVIGVLFPASLTPVIVDLCNIDPNDQVNSISRDKRLNLVHLIKNFPITIYDTGEFKEAIITQGGIDVKEINPQTMETKNIKGLYFIGEVLDVDAQTGGYNLQIAWSTAFLCAISICEK